MIRLISVFTKSQQQITTKLAALRNLQSTAAQEVPVASFSAAKKVDEPDVAPETDPVEEEEDKGTLKSQSGASNNRNRDSGEEGSDKRPFNRRQSSSSSSSNQRSGEGQPTYQNTRILRSSQESVENYQPVNFGVTKDEATAYFHQQLEKLDKHMPLNVFSCLNLSEQQEKAMRYLLQDDEQRNIRGKISSLFKRVQEVGSASEEIVKQVESLIQTAFYKEQSFFISERDFKTILTSKEFIRVVPLFYSRRFFQANGNFLTQLEVSDILKKCRQSPDYYPLLELLKYHKNFFTKNPSQQQKFSTADKELASQFLYDIRGDNTTRVNFLLAFFTAHHLLRVNVSGSFETGDISKHFTRIHFGNSDEKSKREFQSRLHELLNLKIKLGISSSLQHYLCDNFFSFDTYDQALTSIAIHVLILARISEGHHNLNDLFTQYTQTFGQHKFDFYVNEHLPQVLQTLQNKSYVNNLLDSLKLFQNSKANQQQQQQPQSQQGSSYQRHNSSIEFQKLTFFDHAFSVKNGSIFWNYDLSDQTENIPYRYDQGNMLNVDRNSQMNAKLIAFQDAYLNNNRESIVENLLKEATINSEITTAAKKKQKELEPLKKTNPKEYYNQMYIFIYNALDEVYVSEEDSISNYFKGRNIMTPANSYVSSTSLQPMFSTLKRGFSTIKKQSQVGELEDDLNNDANKLQTGAAGENDNQVAKSSKSFSDFMAKVREIDRNSEKTNPFLTKEDIQKMKGLQKGDEGTSGKGRSAEVEATVGATAAKTNEVEVDVKNIEVITPITKPSNTQFFSELFSTLSDQNEAVLRVEKEVYDQRANYHSFINGLASLPEKFAGDLPEGKYLLFKAFTQPSLYEKSENLANLITKVDLTDSHSVVNCKSLRIGELTRDYKDYIPETVFGQGLEYPGYNALLDVCKLHYKRRSFKRILAHIVIYRPQLDKSTVQKIIDISKSARTGVTLFEFTYLLANDPKSNLTQAIFVQLLNSLKNFEDVHEDIETLVKVYLNADLSRKFENVILEGYINSLIRAKSINKLMSMLERLRDYFLARKVPYQTSLTADENNSKQEEFKLQQRAIVQSLFRIYMQKLTSGGLNTFARPLFQELSNMKFSLNEDDFIQGFKSMIESPDDVILLYSQAMEEKLTFGIELIRCLLEVFKRHPKPLAQLTIQVLKEQVYSEKIPIEVQEINEFVLLFTRNDIPAEYSDFLKFLIKYPNKVNDFTKATSFKIVNSITEEMLRQFLKGQIDQVFTSKKQEVLRQQLLSDRQKKRSARKEEPTSAATNLAPKRKQKGAKNANLDQQPEGTVGEAANANATTAAAANTSTTTNKDAKVQEQTVSEVTEGEKREKTEEEVNTAILYQYRMNQLQDKKAKRKVLQKAGVSKFKDIDVYIKGLTTAREEAKK